MTPKKRKMYGSVDAATRHIRGLLEEQRNSDTTVLPSIRILMKQCRVSRMTMLKALHILAAEHQIVIRPGHTARVVQTSSGPPMTLQNKPPLATVTPRWKSLKQRMIDDIINGRFITSKVLPLEKELNSLYATSYHTLKKALMALIDDGWIQKAPRGHTICRPGSKMATSTVVFISSYPNVTSFAATTTRSSVFWSTFETGCIRSNLSVDFWYYYDFYNPDGTKKLHAARMSEPKNTPDVTGYVVFATGFGKDQLTMVFRMLERSGKPVSVVDESNVLASYNGRNPNVKVFIVGFGAQAGVEMGRYLLTNKHHRIAYFQDVGNVTLLEGRRRGLEQVYAEAGSGCGVIRFTSSTEQKRVFINDESTVPPAFRSLEKTLARYGDLFGDAQQLLFSERFLLTYFNMIHSHKVFEPLFEQALTDNTISAWVGANDEVAIHALNFLHKRGIRVPQDVSVAGFDDTVASLGSNLTSYDFNMSGVVNAMLEHLINGSYWRKRRGYVSGLVDFPGILKVRSSCGVRTVMAMRE